MKTILKYLFIFVGIIIFLVSLLTFTAKIPRDKIIENIEESLPYLTEGREVKYIRRKHPFMWLHIYADEMILNIIYNVDSENALKSVMKSDYFSMGFFSLYNQVKSPEIQPNKEYIRYWHGSMIFVRPLLTVFNIQQIYILNAVILSILAIILIYILWKKKIKFLIPIFIIAFIMTGSEFVPFCLEYYWNYLIMFIVSIIALNIDTNKRLYILFFISGILTCFFDFLTTEEITILVPLVFIIASRIKKEQIKDIKSEIKFIIKSMIIWFIGYSFTWFAKWILASIILHINALDYVVDKALIRINGDLVGMSYFEIYMETLRKTILSLYPLNIIKNKFILIIIPIILILIFAIFRKKEKNYKKILPFFIISIIPYLRYAVLVSHSYRHYFFAFRTQFPVIMSIMLIFYFCIDKNMLKKEIKIRKNKGEKLCNKN